MFFSFLCFTSSARAGLGFVWKTTAGRASTSTNVPRVFRAAISASTPTDRSAASVPTGTSGSPVTRRAAGLYQVQQVYSAARVQISSCWPSTFNCITCTKKPQMDSTWLWIIFRRKQHDAVDNLFGSWRCALIGWEHGVTYGICLQLFIKDSHI